MFGHTQQPADPLAPLPPVAAPSVDVRFHLTVAETLQATAVALVDTLKLSGNTLQIVVAGTVIIAETASMAVPIWITAPPPPPLGMGDLVSQMRRLQATSGGAPLYTAPAAPSDYKLVCLGDRATNYQGSSAADLKTATADAFQALKDQITQDIAAGWIPLGGIGEASSTHGLQYGVELCQAMVKYDGAALQTAVPPPPVRPPPPPAVLPPPPPPSTAARLPQIECRGDAYTYCMEGCVSSVPAGCTSARLDPPNGMLGSHYHHSILTFTMESAEYTTTTVNANSVVEVLGRDPSGLVNFRGGFSVAAAGQLVLDSVAFRGLRSQGGYGGGGVIYVAGGRLTATDVEFSDNALLSNPNGGAIYLTSSAVAIFTRAVFSGNTAGVAPLTTSSGGSGGAIYSSSGASLALDSCEFTNNAAQYGGAIWFSAGSGAQLSITGTTFAGSRVTSRGPSYTQNPAIYGLSVCAACTDAAAAAAQPILIERP